MVYGTVCLGFNYNSSPYVDSRVDSNTFTMGNLMPESTLTLYGKADFIPQLGVLASVSCVWLRLTLTLPSLYIGGGGVIPSSVLRAHALQLWRTASMGRFHAHKMVDHPSCVAQRICGFSSKRRHLESRSPEGIFKLLRSPGIDSASLCSLRSGTTSVFWSKWAEWVQKELLQVRLELTTPAYLCTVYK